MQTITETQLYWLTRLDHVLDLVSSFAAIFCLLGFCAMVVGIIFICLSLFSTNKYLGIFEGRTNDELKEIHATQKKIGIRMFVTVVWMWGLSFLMSTVYAMLPTTKEMAAIVVVPKIANSQSVQEIGGEIVTLAKEWLTELHPKKK